MTTRDLIEDAVTAALERGAQLPAEFTVRVPWCAMDSSVLRAPVRVDAITVHVEPEPLFLEEIVCVH